MTVEENKPEEDIRGAPSANADKMAKRPQIQPTLSAYFGDKPIPAAAFAKAVKAAKIDRFTSDDIAFAKEAALEKDADGVLFLQISTQPSKPKAIERWIWPAVQSFLRARIPAAFEAVDCDADTTFRHIQRELQHDIANADPRRRKRAETLLTLSLAWLASQRSINVATTLDHLREIFAGTDSSSRETTRMALAEGKIGTLKKISAVANQISASLLETRKTLERERQSHLAALAKLAEASARIANLETQVEKLTHERDASSQEAASAKKIMNESRQHAGNDIVQIKARHRGFLERRLTPLLNDAVDALEAEPASPNITLKRLKSALAAIRENTE